MNLNSVALEGDDNSVVSKIETDNKLCALVSEEYSGSSTR